MKLFFITGAAMLLIALASGVYVWYVIQGMDTEDGVYRASETPATPTPDKMPTTPPKGAVEETPLPAPDAPPSEEGAAVAEEPVFEITTESLSEEQQKLLSAFGIEDTSLTVTQAMIDCAEGAIGAERLTQITKGSTPSPLEAMRLLPCFKPE